LGVSQRIPQKIKKQIPALVPKISKFEKGLKYANDRADDVKNSNQI